MMKCTRFALTLPASLGYSRFVEASPAVGILLAYTWPVLGLCAFRGFGCIGKATPDNPEGSDVYVL